MEEFKVCKIIAEVASNHMGDMALAKNFIQKSAEAGADYVKFQSSRYEDLVNHSDVQGEWVKKTSLTDEAHCELIEECKKHHIKFLTTCFSITRVGFLVSLGLEEIKVASPDLLSFAMIERLAAQFKHLVISTGMHSIRDIKTAIKFITKNNINATLLHAVSMYPAPLEKTFMYKFLWLKDHFPRVGYSNHTSDIEAIKFAMAHGAEIIEAHMKLGIDGPGRVAAWDILPDDFKEIVAYRKTLTELLGDSKWYVDETFLHPQEQDAQRKFIGRWGDNR
ncbi:MAG: N-acetylneuraminate synthase family protein [Candidatus Omnitrophota bacterium]